MDPNKNSFWGHNRVIPHSAPSTPSEEIFLTPNNSIIDNENQLQINDSGIYGTPLLHSQISNCSVNSDIFGTPDSTLDSDGFKVELRNKNGLTNDISDRTSLREVQSIPQGVIRSKSDFEIPIKNKSHTFLQNLSQNILNLSPSTRRRNQNNNRTLDFSKNSTPNNKPAIFKIPGSPILTNNHPQGKYNQNQSKAISLNSLRHSSGETNIGLSNLPGQQIIRFVIKKNSKLCY